MSDNLEEEEEEWGCSSARLGSFCRTMTGRGDFVRKVDVCQLARSIGNRRRRGRDRHLPRLQSRLAGVLTMCGMMRPLLLTAEPHAPLVLESRLDALAPAAAAATLSVVADEELDLLTTVLLAGGCLQLGGDGGGGGSGSGLLFLLLLFLRPSRLPSLK